MGATDMLRDAHCVDDRRVVGPGVKSRCFIEEINRYAGDLGNGFRIERFQTLFHFVPFFGSFGDEGFVGQVFERDDMEQTVEQSDIRPGFLV